MGTVDEIKATFGDDFFDPKPTGRRYKNWAQLCVCGHIDRYHAETVSGLYQLPGPTTQHNRAGETVTYHHAFSGCVGAMPGRGFEPKTATVDRDTHIGVVTVNPTCPCTAFTPVVMVDRPNRYFNQRMPLDRTDPARHPFMVGIRAFMTHLSRRKQEVANPGWYAEEFDRRFVWMDDARVCSLSKCTTTAEVWPVFVNTGKDQPGDRSELRCPAHR